MEKVRKIQRWRERIRAADTRIIWTGIKMRKVLEEAKSRSTTQLTSLKCSARIYYLNGKMSLCRVDLLTLSQLFYEMTSLMIISFQLPKGQGHILKILLATSPAFPTQITLNKFLYATIKNPVLYIEDSK